MWLTTTVCKKRFKFCNRGSERSGKTEKKKFFFLKSKVVCKWPRTLDKREWSLSIREWICREHKCGSRYLYSFNHAVYSIYIAAFDGFDTRTCHNWSFVSLPLCLLIGESFYCLNATVHITDLNAWVLEG